jgi:hypothetical protein
MKVRITPIPKRTALGLRCAMGLLMRGHDVGSPEIAQRFGSPCSFGIGTARLQAVGQSTP